MPLRGLLRRAGLISSWLAARASLAVMSGAYLVFGCSLVLQPARWGATPAYHVLLEIFRAPTWGALFLVAGAGLGAAAWQATRRRWLVVAALVPAWALTTGWMMSFVVRYLTSGATTPETWVSWAIFDYLLLQAAAGLDGPGRPPGSEP
jgi:hypothetical protein